ncbi:MAG: hypothetical protein R3C18_06855 [Planctomycetaceae bacterium]
MTAQRKDFFETAQAEPKVVSEPPTVPPETSKVSEKQSVWFRSVPWRTLGLVVFIAGLIALVFSQLGPVAQSTVTSGNGALVVEVVGQEIQLRRPHDDEPFETLVITAPVRKVLPNYYGSQLAVLTSAELKVYGVGLKQGAVTNPEQRANDIATPTDFTWCNNDRSLCVWSAPGKLIAFRLDAPEPPHIELSLTSAVQQMAWNDERTVLFVCHENETGRPTGRVVHFEDSLVCGVDLTEMPTQVAVSPNGDFLACASRQGVQTFETLRRALRTDGNRLTATALQRYRSFQTLLQPIGNFELSSDDKSTISDIEFSSLAGTLIMLQESERLTFLDCTRTQAQQQQQQEANPNGSNASNPATQAVTMSVISTFPNIKAIYPHRNINGVVVLNTNGQAQLFDAEHGQPVAEPLPTNGKVAHVAIPQNPPREVSWFELWGISEADSEFLLNQPLISETLEFDATTQELPESKEEFSEDKGISFKFNEGTPNAPQGGSAAPAAPDGSSLINPNQNRPTNWLPSRTFATRTVSGEIELWEAQDAGRTYLFYFNSGQNDPEFKSLALLGLALTSLTNRFGVSQTKFLDWSEIEASRTLSLNDLAIILLPNPRTSPTMTIPEISVNQLLIINFGGYEIVEPSGLGPSQVWQALELSDQQHVDAFASGVDQAFSKKSPHSPLSSQQLAKSIREHMEKTKSDPNGLILRTLGRDDSHNIYFPRPINSQQPPDALKPFEEESSDDDASREAAEAAEF